MKSKPTFLTLCLATLCLIMTATTAQAKGYNRFAGAVYAMTNEFGGNRIIAYGRNANGTLELLGDFPTGGEGAAFDGGEGLDPLISAFSLLPTTDNRYLLAVNAGSNTLTVFRINDDLTLTKTDTESTQGVGPNSIAYSHGLVYVSNIDADGEFLGEPDQEGSLTGFRLNRRGKLIPIPKSTRQLENRPSAIQFSPDGEFLVVSSINAGAAALASESTDELVVYRVRRNGRLKRKPVGSAASFINAW